MARIPILILLLGIPAMSVTSSPNGQKVDSRNNLAFTFTSQQNEQGEFLNKWRLNDAASQLPEKYMVDMNSSVKEENGMKHYQLNVEVRVPPPRPSSYELFPGIGYYKFYPEGAMSYYQALSTCKNDGGHLAIINSEPEMLVLKSIYEKYSDANIFAWLGFNDIEKEGKFETIFGQPLEDTGYAKWDSDQPDGKEKGEDCGAMNREGKLHDIWCTDGKDAPFPFFCEYELYEDQ